MAFSLIKNNPYYTPQQQEKLQGYTQAAAGVSSLLPTEDNPYAFDNFAPLKGAAQGAQLGATFGVPGAIAGAIVGGVAGVAGEAINQAKELDRTPTSFQSVTYDEMGQPVYSGGALSQGLNNLTNIDKASKKRSGAINFNIRKMENTRNKLSQGIETAQNQFNQANIGYNQQLLARAQYEDQLKKNNVYNLPMNFI